MKNNKYSDNYNCYGSMYVVFLYSPSVLKVVEEVTVSLVDDVTALPTSTRLDVVVDGARDWFEWSVGCWGWLSDSESSLPSVSQSEDIAEGVTTQVSRASHHLQLHLGAWQELQKPRVRCGGGAQILRVELHCFTVLGSLARTLDDILHVLGGVQGEEEHFCKRICQEGINYW